MARRTEMDFQALASWALTQLRPARPARKARPVAGKKRVPGAREKRPPAAPDFPRAIELVASRFRLEPSERRLLALLYAIERSLEVAEAARALAGDWASGLTLEAARQALADPKLDRALDPSGRLRAHALVAVESHRGAASELRLGLGLSARLDGDPVDLGPSGWRLLPGAPSPFADELSPSAGAVAIARQELLPARAPLLLSIESCGRRDGFGLGLALARLERGVRILDAEVALARGGGWPLLAAARREAELDGDVLVVIGARSLGESWRALAVPPAPPPTENERPLLVVLADPGKARDLVAHPRFVARTIAWPTIAAPTEAAPARDDGFEQIRQLAVRDAERALGVVRPAPTAAPTPVTETRTVTTAKTTAVTESRAAATETTPVSERSTAARTSAPATPTPTPTPMTPTPPPVTAAPTPAPVAATPLSDEPPYLEVPADAKPEVLARICASSPSSRQRIELISELSGLRNAAVVAAIRANARSEHPGVRAAAEAAMAKIFGPSWNVVRPVPKPVQPPRSDDESA